MTDLVGNHLGHYHLSRLLGHGSFASVYLAEQTYLHTLAALKILHTHLDKETLASFLREVQQLCQLHHPQILPLLDGALEEGIPFLVMTYAPGGTLRRRHPAGTSVPLSVCVSYVKQIASALHYAHAHQLIHRNLKPENLLFGAYDELFLSDFAMSLPFKSAEELGFAAYKWNAGLHGSRTTPGQAGSSL